VGDLKMLDYLCQYGEVRMDCAQFIFSSDDLEVEYHFTAVDVRSYRQSIAECYGCVKRLVMSNVM
jgi:hypothetical protein